MISNKLSTLLSSLFTNILLFTLLTSLFTLLIGCGTTKQVTQLVERVSVDTVYLTNQQYDSIYIFQDHKSDYHRANLKLSETGACTEHGRSEGLKPSETDTLFIKDVSIEYRYKLLRDTIYRTKLETRVDSIPYQVTVTEVKEITRPLTWFDHLTRACFFILLGIVGFYIIRLIRKFFI